MNHRFVLAGVVLAFCFEIHDATAGGLDDRAAAVAAEEHGDPAAAVRLLSRALGDATLSDAVKADVYADRGALYGKTKAADLAIADFNQAIHLDPDSVHAYLGRAAVNRGKGQYQQALDDYDTAIKLNPDATADAYIGRATAYHALGRDGEAVIDDDAALHLVPQSVEALIGRAAAELALHHFKLAIADYAVAIHLKPDAADAYLGRGMAFLQHAKYVDAIADFDATIRMRPDDAPAFVARGSAHLGAGHLEMAADDFSKAIALAPDPADAYSGRGEAEFGLGKYEAAAADFGESLKRVPGSAGIVLWRHVARARLGADDKEELISNAFRLDPKIWPSRLVALYLGSAAPDDIAAATPKRAAARCLAAFHLGEYHLFSDGKAAAGPQLKIAAETCPAAQPEHVLAATELKQLGF